MGVVYAIISLGFAGINDLLFRKYGQKRRPVGLFLCFIGLLMAGFFLVTALSVRSMVFNAPVLIIGSAAGIVSVLANIALVEGMKRTGASVGSTIYRLNLVFVALMAFLFLHETMTPWKGAALVVAMAAISVFSLRSGEAESDRGLKYIPVLVAAALFRACMGIAYKVAANYEVSNEVFLAVSGVWWAIAGFVYYLVRERALRVDASVARYGAISGLLICGIVYFLKLAVNTADASVAVTISQFSFLVTTPLAMVFLRERLNPRKAVGMTLAVIGIVFFSLSG